MDDPAAEISGGTSEELELQSADLPSDSEYDKQERLHSFELSEFVDKKGNSWEIFIDNLGLQCYDTK